MDFKANPKLRPAPGIWERATNSQQRKLVREFDTWSVELKHELTRRAAMGATEAELSKYLKEYITDLESRMLKITNQGIIGATRISAGSRSGLPRIAAASQRQINENTLLVRESLIPKIHEELILPIARGLNANPAALKQTINNLRYLPAQYAGGYWVAIFQTQRELGGIRETERSTLGLPPEPIRWVLDPNAEHCKHSDKGGFYGCPELAGEYTHWAALLSVPAGHVSCRGNCRCHLEVLRDGKWRRGVYDD